MPEVKDFDLHVSSSKVNELIKKESPLFSKLAKDEITCATANYSDIVAIKNPMTFISIHEHLPVLELNGEWFCSPICMLLTQEVDGQLSIEHGFLAKWEDDDHLFWYEDDVISNVIGWMPYPKKQPTVAKTKLIQTLIAKHNHNKNVYWSLDLLSEIELSAPDCFMPVELGIPPLHIENGTNFESDVYLVEYEYSTANGIFTGLSTAKLVFNKESNTLEWDNSNFYPRHALPRDVIHWKKLPMDVSTQFQKNDQA